MPAGAMRLGLRLAAMLGWLALCVVAHGAWRLFRPASPWPRLFLRGIGRVAGARVTICGRPAVGAGTLLLANHVSWLDIPVLAGSSGAAFVAHSGLATNAMLKWLCDRNHTVFVSRHRRGSVSEQVAQVRAALDRDQPLAIFAEGTTSDGTGVLPFNSSLLSAIEGARDEAGGGLTVQPVAIDYGRGAPVIAWIGEEHGIDNFRRILARRGRIAVTLRFLPALEPHLLHSRKTIAAEAGARIAATFKA